MLGILENDASNGADTKDSKRFQVETDGRHLPWQSSRCHSCEFVVLARESWFELNVSWMAKLGSFLTDRTFFSVPSYFFLLQLLAFLPSFFLSFFPSFLCSFFLPQFFPSSSPVLWSTRMEFFRAEGDGKRTNLYPTTSRGLSRLFPLGQRPLAPQKAVRHHRSVSRRRTQGLLLLLVHPGKLECLLSASPMPELLVVAGIGRDFAEKQEINHRGVFTMLTLDTWRRKFRACRTDWASSGL